MNKRSLSKKAAVNIDTKEYFSPNEDLDVDSFTNSEENLDNLETIEDKVIEAHLNLLPAMDQTEYTRRLKEVKVAMKNVSYSIENFPVVLVEIMHSIERRAITDSMKVFNNLVLDLEVDLDGNEYAVNRLAKLEQMWKEVLDEFLIT